SPDGTILVCAGSDVATGIGVNFIRLWSVATGKERATLKPKSATDDGGYHPGYYGMTFSGLALSPDGKYLAASEAHHFSFGSSRTVRLWELATRQEILEIGLSGRVGALAFSRDGTALLTSGGIGLKQDQPTVALWDLTTGRELGQLKGH